MKFTSIKDCPTAPSDKISKKKAKKDTKKFIKRIEELQNILYAQGKYSILVLFQGRDASGKDGATKAVFSSLNPQGVGVTSFKKPTSKEFSYDFLWRVHAEVPAKGMIKIFNRSHYEDVLVPRVEKFIGPAEIHKRYEHINNFEKLLRDNNTITLKFFLHVSRDVQAERLLERVENPMKRWKFNQEDTRAASMWKEYNSAYDGMFNNCSKIPWIIVPADKNWYKEYIIAKTVCATLEKLPLEYPNSQIISYT